MNGETCQKMKSELPNQLSFLASIVTGLAHGYSYYFFPTTTVVGPGRDCQDFRYAGRSLRVYKLR